MQVELDFVETWETLTSVVERKDRMKEALRYTRSHGTRDFEHEQTLTERIDSLLRAELNLRAALQIPEPVPA